MDKSQSLFVGRRVPVLTLLMVGGACLVALVPTWAPWLIYDRPAILSWQLWRLFTGHWVHFSIGHLAGDIIPFGVAAWIIEDRGLPRFRWFCFLAPWVISAAALLFEPQMRFCCGLSGLACAMITLLALRGLSEAGSWHWVCVAALAGIAGKTLIELVTGHCVFLTINGEPVIVSVTNHIAGTATALIFFAWGFGLDFSRGSGNIQLCQRKV